MTKYTVETLTWRHVMSDHKLLDFICESGWEVSEKYGHPFKWQHAGIKHLIKSHRFTVCRREGEPVGFMFSSVLKSKFDEETIILRQDLLYARPQTRAAKYLLDDFIDFGKLNANHIISMIGEKTNIKPRSLEKLGFKKLETLYRIEV